MASRHVYGKSLVGQSVVLLNTRKPRCLRLPYRWLATYRLMPWERQARENERSPAEQRPFLPQLHVNECVHDTHPHTLTHTHTHTHTQRHTNTHTQTHTHTHTYRKRATLPHPPCPGRRLAFSVWLWAPVLPLDGCPWRSATFLHMHAVTFGPGPSGGTLAGGPRERQLAALTSS